MRWKNHNASITIFYNFTTSSIAHMTSWPCICTKLYKDNTPGQHKQLQELFSNREPVVLLHFFSSFLQFWLLRFSRKVFYAHHVPDSAYNLVFMFHKLTIDRCKGTKLPLCFLEKFITSKALTMSSLVWAAEMQIRALANNKGVAGNATVTTATFDHKIKVNHIAIRNIIDNEYNY